MSTPQTAYLARVGDAVDTAHAVRRLTAWFMHVRAHSRPTTRIIVLHAGHVDRSHAA